MENRRGDISSRYFVIAVVLIASFAVILFLFFTLFRDSETQFSKQACKTSVVLRHTFNVGPVEAGRGTIPLKCETEKICVYSEENKCEDSFGKSSKKNPVTFVKISDEENAKNEILDAVSQALYNCNDILGKGNLNFFPSNFLESSYCTICSRLVFEDEIKTKFKDKIKFIELYEYMEAKKDVNGNSYLKDVYDIDNAETIRLEMQFLEQKIKKGEVDIAEGYKDKVDIDNLKASDFSTDNWFLDLDNEQIIMVKIIKPGDWRAKIAGISVGGVTVSAVGVLLIALPTGVTQVIGGTLFAAGVVGGSVAGGMTYYETHPGEDFVYQKPLILPNNLESYAREGCEYFENLP